MREHHEIKGRFKAIARQYDLRNLKVFIAKESRDWIQTSLATQSEPVNDLEIYHLNAATAGVEFRENDEGCLEITAFHRLGVGMTFDENEMRFLCLQMRKALDELSCLRGLRTREILLGE